MCICLKVRLGKRGSISPIVFSPSSFSNVEFGSELQVNDLPITYLGLPSAFERRGLLWYPQIILSRSL
jgi:hypothetical protein